MTRCQTLGRAIRDLKNQTEGTPEESFFRATGGFKLFQGKITDVLRETRGAFNFGRVVLDGIGAYKGRGAFVEFQNENLLASVDGEILATVPDLICLVDTETFTPVPTDTLKYGKRVYVVGLKCFELWRCEAGLALVGPRYFGCDTDYIPVEERSRGGTRIIGSESTWAARPRTPASWTKSKTAGPRASPRPPGTFTRASWAR
jgi:DUF917 family protein